MNNANFKKYEDDFIHALLSINKARAEEILSELVKEECLITIGDKFLAPALERIGKDWEKGITSLAQVYLSGHMCNTILDKMLLSKESFQKKQPPMAIATLSDFHTLGKRIVFYSLKVSGYKVDDFGHGLLIHDLVNKCQENKTEILLVSTLMLPSALLVKHLIEALKDGDLHVKVIVGGAPFYFDRELWKEVGADAMGYNASDALGIVKRLSGELK
ncbi:MAG: cobalamin-dependent protein [Deltaproteobacteria bacterium]|nr:cobalamin-dependent protein [Deltaproteobacteria bacterium]